MKNPVIFNFIQKDNVPEEKNHIGFQILREFCSNSIGIYIPLNPVG